MRTEASRTIIPTQARIPTAAGPEPHGGARKWFGSGAGGDEALAEPEPHGFGLDDDPSPGRRPPRDLLEALSTGLAAGAANRGPQPHHQARLRAGRFHASLPALLRPDVCEVGKAATWGLSAPGPELTHSCCSRPPIFRLLSVPLALPVYDPAARPESDFQFDQTLGW